MKKTDVIQKIKILVCLSVVVAVLVACSSEPKKEVLKYEEVTESTRGPNYGRDPKIGNGFDGKTISLGVIAPLSGQAGFLGRALTNGAQTYWDAKNAQGGVGKEYLVQLISQDSASSGVNDKDIALQAYDELSDQVVAFQQVYGIDVIESLKEKQIRDEMLIIPSRATDELVKNPLVVPITSPYQTHVINGVAYYASYSDNTNPIICSLALEDSNNPHDPMGEDIVESLNFATQNLSLKYGAKETFKAGTSISTQVKNLIIADCDAAVVMANDTDAINILAAFAQEKSDIDLIGLPSFWIPETDLKLSSQAKAYAVKHLQVASAGAEWGDKSIEGMDKMLKDVQAQNPSQKSNPLFLYGYAQAWAMDQILEEALDNGDLSTAGVANALANVGTFNFEGLIPDFKYDANTRSRRAPSKSTIYKYDSLEPSRLKLYSDEAFDFSSPAAKKYKYR